MSRSKDLNKHAEDQLPGIPHFIMNLLSRSPEKYKTFNLFLWVTG